MRSCLKLGDTIKTAIEALNGPSEGLAIVLNSSEQVIGIMTDGDVRRAIIIESRLDAIIDNYITKSFISVTQDETKNQVLDLMQVYKLKHIPILDPFNRLIGIHLLHDIVGGKILPNYAVIMAGGKGIRLRPLTENVPKPMLKVAGRPILERIVLHLVGCGIKHIYISVNYLSEVIINYFGDGKKFGCEIYYLNESQELGTAGSLKLLPSIPKDPFLVINGDLVTQVDVASMIEFHNNSGSIATIGSRPYSYRIPYGCLDLKNDRVVGIEEKPILERKVNAGIYVLSPSVIKLIPQEFYQITDLFQDLLSQGKKISSYNILSEWIDIGEPHELSKARGA